MELSLPLRLPRSQSHRGRAGVRPGGDLALEILRSRSRAVRGTICLVLALPLLGGVWMWLRASSLVAIRHVHIAGVHGPDAIAIRAALDRSAEGMTTMRFSAAALRAAVAGYPIVASVSARPSFPHGVSIQVTERPPVAVLVAPGERSAVAADGTVLGPALASSALPAIAARSVPAPGKRIVESAPLAAATVLGAAPAALLRYVVRVYEGDEGLTAQMRNGLLVYFGDATLPHAKWLSLARVLSSSEATGALYVDVRLPSRPAAGFTLAPPAPATATAASRIGGADPTAATLAERLAQATGTGPSGAATGEESQSDSGGAAASTGGESEERSSAAAGTGGTGGGATAPAAGADEQSATVASGGAAREVEASPAGGTQAPEQPSSSG